MNNKSSRNLFYSVTAFILLTMFWSLLSYFFTDYKNNSLTQALPWLILTTSTSWLLVLAKLRKNEVTISSTQELILYMISFPAISLLTALIVKVFDLSFRIQFIPFVFSSVIIACLTWILLRLNEKMEFSFGRRVKIHSKLTDEQLDTIRQCLIDTRLENHIDLSRGSQEKNLTEFDLMIVSNTSDIDDEILNAHLAGTQIESFDNFLISLHGRIKTNEYKMSADYFTLKRVHPLVMLYQKMKIVVEPLVATLMAIIMLPALLIIAAIVRSASKGPAIFKQVRTGHNGKLFTLYKFRTMNTDAEKEGPKWSSSNDDRVNSVGKFLRATHLDELPQIFNVILGDMSFVGPRPELPQFYESLKKDIPNFHLRTLIKPGITGWAQIKNGYANSIDTSKAKLEFDLYYIFNLSLLLDLQIIVDTLTGNKVKEVKTQENYDHSMVAHSKK